MIVRIPIERVFDNPFQTRQVYTDIEELAESILKMKSARPETSGLIQVPTGRIVIENGRQTKVLNPDEYGGVESCLGDEPLAVVQLAVAHRRKRAFAHLLQVQGDEDYATFPVEILVLDDRRMSDIAWEENNQRKDLTAIEEAEALQRAIEEFGYTQAEIGERWGLSQSAVANKIRLLQLPEQAQEPGPADSRQKEPAGVSGSGQRDPTRSGGAGIGGGAGPGGVQQAGESVLSPARRNRGHLCRL
jgi:hypothetical protein